MSDNTSGSHSIPLAFETIAYVVPQSGIAVLANGRVFNFNEIYGYAGQMADEIGVVTGAVVGICGTKIFAGIGMKP